jgi:3-phosphoshikimate 1-carboxyvinyltransferase
MVKPLSKAGPMRETGALPMEFGPVGPLRGTVSLPGDKSISHRALMLAAMACGHSRIDGLCDGSDVRSTIAALRAMGARVESAGGRAWDVDGVGTGGLLQPEAVLDMGNSGTSTRLLMGLVASHPISAAFTGDESLCRRPMDRVIEPLARIGADIAAAPGGRLPLTLRGLTPAVPAEHRLTVASAQVKSALLLAALNIPGVTRVVEPVPTRDHSERLLRRFGADIRIEPEGSGNLIALRGEADLKPQHLRIPGDPSAAAFLVVAALIVPGSEIRIEGVGVNPMRTGLFDMLRAMGGDLEFDNVRDLDGEPVADLVARHSPLEAVDVPPEMVPRMIDEFPVFFVAAAFADGVSRATGLGELRLKESDRIGALAEGLDAIAIKVEERDDGLVIRGSAGGPLPGGAALRSHLDHRLAMAFAVAGLHCREAIGIDDMSPVDTSFPCFASRIAELGSK